MLKKEVGRIVSDWSFLVPPPLNPQHTQSQSKWNAKRFWAWRHNHRQAIQQHHVRDWEIYEKRVRAELFACLVRDKCETCWSSLSLYELGCSSWQFVVLVEISNLHPSIYSLERRSFPANKQDKPYIFHRLVYRELTRQRQGYTRNFFSQGWWAAMMDLRALLHQLWATRVIRARLPANS